MTSRILVNAHAKYMHRTSPNVSFKSRNVHWFQSERPLRPLKRQNVQIQKRSERPQVKGHTLITGNNAHQKEKKPLIQKRLERPLVKMVRMPTRKTVRTLTKTVKMPTSQN